ncbi:MAG TPA: Rieske (2Fe-2S) protein [Candidatus Limnocylindrales bacterium]|nr:Rieske (2Fe-2S) protein [Candidatus Limnocylindrales bacterium]
MTRRWHEVTVDTTTWWPLSGPLPVAGAPVVVSVDGVDVAVVRLGDRFVAFDDTCSHRQCPLSEGELDERTVTCPCHRSRFDLTTGAPLDGPARQPIRIRRVVPDGDGLLIER